MSTKSDSNSETAGATTQESLDAVIVGAGFSGLFMLHKLRGMGLSAKVYEAGDGIGGTWYWNSYPGARCDIQSVEYSYQFSEDLQQDWDWSERYASQPEILSYLEHVADRFDLRRDVVLNTKVKSAEFDEKSSRWKVTSADGRVADAQFLIMATGALSTIFYPDIPGRETFKGQSAHTGAWPLEGLDFQDKRVGVIGTGSSGIQCIPIIAEQAEHLTVFQRSPAYSVPAGNHDLDPDWLVEFKNDYSGLRKRNEATMGGFGSDHPINNELAMEVSEKEREDQYQHRWQNVGGLLFLGAYADLLTDPAANQTAAEFVRQKIRETVIDPDVAERLTPTTMIGCKRLCTDTNYYETYNRPNVSLVDIKNSPIEEITETGLRVGENSYDLDCIVFATGFDAMTGAISNVDIRGKDGVRLTDKWADGPVNYLGVGTAGFPNLFTIVGPGNPSVLTNMVCTIEHHVGWVAECIEYLRANSFSAIEVTPAAELDWVAEVNAIAESTLFPTCNSWYLGANIPGKPRVFMPYLGLPPYREKCAEVAQSGYSGFVLTKGAV
ncbi:MAG: NAD(P)-binding domain-containing protein [Gammaproteobacteria bacterium]|jgi:cyclohexanone monooxygenase|nr:NAD(P)-binding domain-containing protein [Gammaproteobacteria bacterium]